jgi:hypothetical protein
MVRDLTDTAFVQYIRYIGPTFSYIENLKIIVLQIRAAGFVRNRSSISLPFFALLRACCIRIRRRHALDLQPSLTCVPDQLRIPTRVFALRLDVSTSKSTKLKRQAGFTMRSS